MRTAKRFALPACGRDVDFAWEQKKLEARKMLEIAQNPQCQVHQGECEHPLSGKKLGRNGSILQMADIQAVQSNGDGLYASRGAPWSPINMIHPLVAQYATPFRKL